MPPPPLLLLLLFRRSPSYRLRAWRRAARQLQQCQISAAAGSLLLLLLFGLLPLLLLLVGLLRLLHLLVLLLLLLIARAWWTGRRLSGDSGIPRDRRPPALPPRQVEPKRPLAPDRRLGVLTKTLCFKSAGRCGESSWLIGSQTGGAGSASTLLHRHVGAGPRLLLQARRTCLPAIVHHL